MKSGIRFCGRKNWKLWKLIYHINVWKYSNGILNEIGREISKDFKRYFAKIYPTNFVGLLDLELSLWKVKCLDFFGKKMSMERKQERRMSRKRDFPVFRLNTILGESLECFVSFSKRESLSSQIWEWENVWGWQSVIRVFSVYSCFPLA